MILLQKIVPFKHISLFLLCCTSLLCNNEWHIPFRELKFYSIKIGHFVKHINLKRFLKYAYKGYAPLIHLFLFFFLTLKKCFKCQCGDFADYRI